MTSESLREAHDAALWKIHRVRTMNGNVYVVAVGDLKDTLNKMRAEVQSNRDDWIKGLDPEWYAYDRCLGIIDKYREEQTC